MRVLCDPERIRTRAADLVRTSDEFLQASWAEANPLKPSKPLPTTPGLGVELDEDALADKIDHDWQNPKSYAEDGSAIDW